GGAHMEMQETVLEQYECFAVFTVTDGAEVSMDRMLFRHPLPCVPGGPGAPVGARAVSLNQAEAQIRRIHVSGTHEAAMVFNDPGLAEIEDALFVHEPGARQPPDYGVALAVQQGANVDARRILSVGAGAAGVTSVEGARF